jgi:hypothetical protein
MAQGLTHSPMKWTFPWDNGRRKETLEKLGPAYKLGSDFMYVIWDLKFIIIMYPCHKFVSETRLKFIAFRETNS